jgi:DNA-directed RNA polymerase subunit RPC12/RpoP
MSRLQVGVNDLATRFPDVAAQVYGSDPTKVTYGSGKKLDWLGVCGHVWTASVESRTRKIARGCPYCSGQKLLVGFNDLATTHPYIAAMAYDWDPATVLAGTEQRRDWICPIGHIWDSRVNNITHGKRCPFCASKRVLVGFNDLAFRFPSVAYEVNGWDPTMVTWGSRRSLPWKCKSGHTWNSAVSDRTSGGQGCPGCMKNGFNKDLDGYLYLLRHDEFKLLKIGISNFLEQRIDQHKKNGWSLLDSIGPMSGAVAREDELAILYALDSLGIERGIVHKELNGFTETWKEEDLSAENIDDLRTTIGMSKKSKEWIFTKRAI